MATFKIGEKVVVADRNCFYREKTVDVLRACGDQHPDLVVVGFQTANGGSVEWITHTSYLKNAPASQPVAVPRIDGANGYR